jgi:hypothetical protein
MSGASADGYAAVVASCPVQTCPHWVQRATGEAPGASVHLDAAAAVGARAGDGGPASGDVEGALNPLAGLLGDVGDQPVLTLGQRPDSDDSTTEGEGDR